jgi:hypothetical protein
VELCLLEMLRSDLGRSAALDTYLFLEMLMALNKSPSWSGELGPLKNRTMISLARTL